MALSAKIQAQLVAWWSAKKGAENSNSDDQVGE